MHSRVEVSAQVLRLRWRRPLRAQLANVRFAVRRANELLTFSNAVASPAKSTPQLFTEAVICGVLITDLLLDTGSACSMLITAMYGRLPSVLAIQPFTGAAPDIVNVGGAIAEVHGYVDAHVELDGTAVGHPLLVVDGLAFALLIRINNLCPHGSTL